MAEDFATGQENVYPIHIEDAQHVLLIHKYNQAYHDKWKKQQDDCNKIAHPQRTKTVQPLGMYPT